jgi:hypothetical protein
MGTINPTGYSAKVELWLQAEGGTVPLTHTCETFVIAARPTELPPGEATLVVSIDDKRIERAVRLVEGMRADRRRTPIETVGDVAPF